MIASAYRNAVLSTAPLSWRDTAIVAATSSLSAITCIIGLYLVKAALGINLTPGPSFLHDLLYWLVV